MIRSGSGSALKALSSRVTATEVPGSIRSVVMISVRPALPILVVLTLQAAEPAPLPVFSTLISTESPPGIETGALICAVGVLDDLFELDALTKLGGQLLAAGFLVAFGISSVTPLPAIVEPWSVVLGISVTAMVGLFFGLYPAMRAASLDPIEALRKE